MEVYIKRKLLVYTYSYVYVWNERIRLAMYIGLKTSVGLQYVFARYFQQNLIKEGK